MRPENQTEPAHGKTRRHPGQAPDRLVPERVGCRYIAAGTLRAMALAGFYPGLFLRFFPQYKVIQMHQHKSTIA